MALMRTKITEMEDVKAEAHKKEGREWKCKCEWEHHLVLILPSHDLCPKNNIDTLIPVRSHYRYGVYSYYNKYDKTENDRGWTIQRQAPLSKDEKWRRKKSADADDEKMKSSDTKAKENENSTNTVEVPKAGVPPTDKENTDNQHKHMDLEQQGH